VFRRCYLEMTDANSSAGRQITARVRGDVAGEEA
jgi:hypothetical protein